MKSNNNMLSVSWLTSDIERSICIITFNCYKEMVKKTSLFVVYKVGE